MTQEEKLATLYKQAAELNEELPVELLKKLRTYGDILSLTGKLHAESLKDWKLAEVVRKEAVAKCYTYDPEGTVKDREYKAEFAASEHRRREAIAEANCMRWRNAMESIREIIQIMKLQLRDMHETNKGGI